MYMHMHGGEHIIICCSFKVDPTLVLQIITGLAGSGPPDQDYIVGGFAYSRTAGRGVGILMDHRRPNSHHISLYLN